MSDVDYRDEHRKALEHIERLEARLTAMSGVTVREVDGRWVIDWAEGQRDTVISRPLMEDLVGRLAAAEGLAKESTDALLRESVIRDALIDTLTKWADEVDAQQGRTSMTMQMHGFSPVGFMARVRDYARAFLAAPEREAGRHDEGKCGHWYYRDTLGPETGQVVRDGVAYPVLMDPGPIRVTEDTVAAEPFFFERKACPVCTDPSPPEGKAEDE